ncbi:MAG: diadenylate cyclase CdaA [Kiritimatiellae bacterium]|nr:diadenylate cyclase CdaA [Kiritimatiellia bacterium]
MTILSGIQWPGSVGYLEILVLGILFYYIMLFFRGTRGAQVLTGFVLAMVLLMFITQFFRLDALNWILKQVSVYLSIAFIIIFQPEIRRALAELGRQPVFSASRSERSLVDKLIQATLLLAERKIGALIAIEGEIGTRTIQESGTRLDARLTPELLATIFFPHTPLHDGGVIIQNERIMAAGCFFPLTSREEVSKALGTRHRAAIGLTEETDALVIVVSEETGTISIAYRGRLSRSFDEERLRRLLQRVLVRGKQSRSRLRRVKEQLKLSTQDVFEEDEWMKESEDEG